MLTLVLISALAADALPRASWVVDCDVDKIDDTRSCKLWNLNPLFQVITVGADAPVVVPGVPDFPGRKGVRVRVDQNKAIAYEPLNPRNRAKPSAELLKQLRGGKVVRFEYEKWPEGTQLDELDLAYFAEALDELLRAQKGSGEHHWPPPPPVTQLEFRNRNGALLWLDGERVSWTTIKVDPGEHELRVVPVGGDNEFTVKVTAKEGVTGTIDVADLLKR